MTIIKPTKAQAAKIAGIVLGSLLVMQGAYSATVNAVNAVNRKLDSYSITRVESRHLLAPSKATTVTQVVPVIEKVDAADLLK